MTVGTLAWARRTGGRIGRADRLRLIADAIVVRANGLRWHRKPPFTTDVGSFRIPDTALCVAAGQLLTAVSDAWLVNHCLRTFLWATLLGRMDGHRYDEELLFVSSALHDLGLTDAGAKLSPTSTECFAIEGALAADAFMMSQMVAEERRARVAEAIALHLNIRVPLKHGVEAHLLHAGAGFDVVGSRYAALAPSTRDQVLLRHPRLDAKDEFVARMKQQSRARPYSRAAFLCSHGFLSLIRQSPFSS